ncbi:hypothetical protein BG842_21270 [Haladaptatus sp. W1]|nr:hypothetical protein BG842_21270 [Haladaptatus sp. W1]
MRTFSDDEEQELHHFLRNGNFEKVIASSTWAAHPGEGGRVPVSVEFEYARDGHGGHGHHDGHGHHGGHHDGHGHHGDDDHDGHGGITAGTDTAAATTPTTGRTTHVSHHFFSDR